MIDCYEIKEKYSAICLISSAGCNLNCKYCEISKSKDHSYSDELQQKIKTAFEDGSFLLNVSKTYQILHQDFNNITFLNFWGQEPTLTLDSFRTRLEDWFNTFPNINEIFFSTNGGTDPEIIYNFICDIDKIINHDIKIGVQFSYDGEWSCLHERMIDPNLIKEHFSKLVNLLNVTQLKYAHVNFSWHGVLNFNLLYHLLETNGIDEYLYDLDNIAFWGSNLIRNPNCKVFPLTLGLEQPYKASVDDGIALKTFLEKGLRTELKYKFYIRNPIRNLLENLVGRINSNNNIFKDNLWIQLLIDTFNGKKIDRATCSSYKTELKFMYDGTILGCQNFLFNTTKDHIIDTNPVMQSIKENAIDHNLFINFNNSNLTIEDIDKVFIRYKNHHTTSFLTAYQSILNMIILLATAGQASNEYLINKEKLFKHALMIARYNVCLFNHMITTGSTYLEPIHLCRMFCNGALDIIENEYCNCS